jgi:hypothetical protein
MTTQEMQVQVIGQLREHGGRLTASDGPAERKLSALAHAIREHESELRRRPLGVRPPDASLYKRLRQILG